MLSHMAISAPLNSDLSFYEDVTWACWPSYRRVSLAMGGDFEASFTITGMPDVVLEYWFENYLGAHFEETFEGAPAFVGRVERMVLAYNGFVLSRDLKEVFNAVRVRYKSESGGAEFVTTEFSDTASIALFGTRQLVASPNVFLWSTPAQQYGNGLLDRLKKPRVKSERIAIGAARQPGQLQVTVRGYVHSLEAKLLKSTSTSQDSASDEVTEALVGADFVTAGRIDANVLQVVEEVDYEPAWKRIAAIAELGDEPGNPWQAGCYQGRQMDYAQADVDNIYYRVRYKENRRLAEVELATGGPVPPAFVRPGVVAFSDDILPGVPVAAPLLDDPRAAFIAKVTYDRTGAVLEGADEDLRRVAVELALKDALEKLPEYTVEPGDEGEDGWMAPAPRPRGP